MRQRCRSSRPDGASGDCQLEARTHWLCAPQPEKQQPERGLRTRGRARPPLRSRPIYSHKSRARRRGTSLPAGAARQRDKGALRARWPARRRVCNLPLPPARSRCCSASRHRAAWPATLAASASSNSWFWRKPRGLLAAKRCRRARLCRSVLRCSRLALPWVPPKATAATKPR